MRALAARRRLRLSLRGREGLRLGHPRGRDVDDFLGSRALGGDRVDQPRQFRQRVFHAGLRRPRRAQATFELLQIDFGERRPTPPTADRPNSASETGDRSRLRGSSRLKVFIRVHSRPMFSITASSHPQCCFPPKSGVRYSPSLNSRATARSTNCPASSIPKC